MTERKKYRRCCKVASEIISEGKAILFCGLTMALSRSQQKQKAQSLGKECTELLTRATEKA